MNIRIFPSVAQASQAVAHLIAHRLDLHPATVLGLPTGRTLVPVYQELVRLHASGQADFSRAHAFGLDEFVGVSGQHQGSFRAFLNHQLMHHVNIRPAQVEFLDGAAEDLDGECIRFEQAIAAAGGIDLLILGIGANGHIGFNEPGDELYVHTHRSRLRLATRRANSGLFGRRVTRVPREALSMGVGTILAARTIVLVATGRSKARAVHSMATGRVTTSFPASFLQLHHEVQLVLDRAAGVRF
jgi:glucosamine-6-phosphate deaminase